MSHPLEKGHSDEFHFDSFSRELDEIFPGVNLPYGGYLGEGYQSIEEY